MTFFLKSITNASIKNNKDGTSNKYIRLLFNLVFISICFGLTLTIVDLLKFGALTNNLIGHLNFLVMYITVLVINYFGYYKIAAIIFVFYLIFGFFLFASVLTPNIFAEFNLMIIPCLALMLFKKIIIPIISLVTSFIAFITVFIFFTSYENNTHFPEYIVLFASLFFIVNYYKKNNDRNETLLKKEKITIEKQAEDLEKLNEFKSHFFVNLSHEIRTPITIIKGYTSKIELNKNDSNKQKLKIVNSQVQQIENILNNIIDLSRLDADKLTLEKRDTELTPLLNKHFTNFKTLFLNKAITFNLNNNIPSVKINMDANLISKSINNLLNNALKFTPKNGNVAINVSLNNNLQIRFTDNGIGIPKEDIDKIFDRFYQSKNDITLSQGSGIGLSFTKSIIDAHGFYIKAISEPNIKTEFIITIPKKYIINNNLAITNVITAQKNIEKNSARPTILVVDDHTQMRGYIKSLLNNYNVLEAKDGKEALTILKNETIDLLLTDYMMPVMNGKELVKEVKKLRFKIPVIIITARVDDFAKLNMLRIGVDGYLNKPFVEEELLLFIKNSLKAYHKIISSEENLGIEEQKEIEDFSIKFNAKISSFINDNISKSNFGVEDVAKYFETSKSTLNRKVKSILGQTTQELIIQARVEKARTIYLKNPYLSQKEIANAVGMKNAVHLFKKISEFYGEHYC